ncbi:hypothetical protein LY76DRAFT_397394 [Colletotrichum caudatum]|nr:hypothetical protein LY76DRAFT_397394 [Colletotrichum caudatum]
MTAAGNEERGEEVIKLLLTGRAQVEVTNRLVKVVPGAFGEVMKLLLEHGGKEVEVSDEILETAA